MLRVDLRAAACRQAFRLFLERIIPPGSFRVTACGSRANTFQDFRTALRRHPHDYVILLVDSEEPVATGPWVHLGNSIGDQWHQPHGTSNDQVHLRVQVMESRFLADPATLVAYHGDGFLAGSLPGQPNVELLQKQDVLRALEHASKPTQKGVYHKTRHAFDLREKINPTRLRGASIHAERLFTVLVRETTV